MGILSALWLLWTFGTVVAMVISGEFLIALRFVVGSFVAVGAGSGLRGTFHAGKYVQGLAIAAVAFALSVFVTPSPLRLGPAIWAPDFVWLIGASVLGFLYWKPEDNDPPKWMGN